MPKYVIERNSLTPGELAAVSDESCSVLHSEHERLGGFPANSIAEIKAVIDPTTAEALALAKTQEHDSAKEAGVY
jgi:hypothetical protein